MRERATRRPRKEPPAFCAVVPAAGSGTRMGGGCRKPMLCLDGAPILLHTLARLRAARGCRAIVLAVHPDDLAFCRDCWGAALAERFGVRAIVPGGAVRQESVLAALEATDPDTPLALIHDAVRPLVRLDLVEAVAARAAERGAAIAAVPSVATIKEVDGSGRIVATPPRERLWMAQTPQGFDRGLILSAHRAAVEHGLTGTDDALLVEQFGREVVVVEDSPDNIKITTPEDLAVAEAILTWQRQKGVRGADVPIPGPDVFEPYRQ